MPPMTVVWPSLACTNVLALCVLIGGMPLATLVVLAVLERDLLMTLLLAVICGVTLR
jgi:hypothetical protein